MIALLFPKKIGRIAYLFRLLIFIILAAPVSFEMTKVEDEDYVPSLSLLLSAIAALLYWFMYIVRPRCRDCGWSHWLAIVTFVPFLNLCLWIALLFPSSLPADDLKEPTLEPTAPSGRGSP